MWVRASLALLLAVFSVVQGQCSQTLGTSSSGYITYPLPSAGAYYPPSTTCTWQINAPVFQRVYFSFANLSLADGDILTASSTPTDLSTVVSFATPIHVPPAQYFLSTFNTLLINFTSDAYLEGFGFSLYWTYINPNAATCNDSVVVPSGSTFSNIVGPVNAYSRYPINKNCQWILTAPNGQQVSLTFSYFSIYLHDYVNVYDGSSTSAPLIVSLGDWLMPPMPDPVASSGSTMLVQFTSNGGNNANGFVASWASFTNAADCAATNSPSGASGKISAPLNYDGLSRYSPGSACTWSFVASGANNRVRLHLTAVTLAPGDTVIVYDGIDDTANVLFSADNNTDATMTSPIFSSDVNMYVVFTSVGASVPAQYHGFAADWAAIPFMPCDALYTPVTAGSGSIAFPVIQTAPSGGNTCGWGLQATGGFARVSLSIPIISLGLGDSLVLYDGNSASSPVIATLTGAIAATTLLSTQTSVFALLTLNQMVTVPAFTINWAGTNNAAHCLPYSFLTGTGGTVAEPFASQFGTTAARANSICTWYIHPTYPNVARFSVSNIDLGTGDRLRVYVGTDNTGQLLADFTERVVSDVFSGDNTMFVEFITGSTPGNGFAATWSGANTGLCSYASVTPYSVNNQSQWWRYPNALYSRYQSNGRCGFRFTAPAGYIVQLTINSINLENNIDFLTFYDGAGQSSDIILRATGSTAQTYVTSTGTDLYAYFASDSQNIYYGWSINYTQVIASGHCSGVVQINGTSGQFGEPFNNQPGLYRYLPNMDCWWNITALPGQRVYVHWLNTHTYDFNDTLTMYDGPSMTSPVLRCFAINTDYAFHGQWQYGSSYENMLIHFKSDAQHEESGFQVQWSSLAGPPTCTNGVPIEITSLPYDLQYGGDPWYYRPNSNCSWHIKPANPTSPRIQVLVRNSWLMANDSFFVYDGPDTNSPLMRAADGVQGQPMSYAFSGEVFITFISDGANEDWGFWLQITETNDTGNCAQLTVYPGKTSGVIQNVIPYAPNTYMYSLFYCAWSIKVESPYNQVIFNIIVPSYWTMNQIVTFNDTAPYNFQAKLPCTVGYYGYLTQNLLWSINNGYNAPPSVYFEWRAAAVSACTSETQTGNSGTFSTHTPADPGTVYLPNSNCAWLLTTSAPNTQIRLYFDNFGLNVGDTVRVYDGANATSRLLFSWAQYTPYVGGFVSTGLSMYVTFTSDAYSSGPSDKGFTARWEAGTVPGSCSGVVLATGSGIIQNPVPWDGANFYSTGSICNWLLTPSAGYNAIVLYITSLKTDNDPVTVYDGGTISAPTMGSWTANPGWPRASSGANMLITFTANHQNYGFNMNWTSVNLPPVCGAINFLDDPSEGMLAYPPPWGQGFRYQSGLDCSFLLQAPDGLRMQATLQYLDVNQGDYVYFYDGYHTGAPLITSCTKNTNPCSATLPMVSSQQYMLVRFTSELLSVPALGFNALYESTTRTGTVPDVSNLPIYACDYAGVVSIPTPYDTKNGLGRYSATPCKYAYYYIRANSGTSKINMTIDGWFFTYGAWVRIFDGNSTAAREFSDGIYWNSYFPTGTVHNYVTTGPVMTVWVNTNYGSYLRFNWTAVGDTGVPRNVDCAPIPIPMPPPGPTTTSTTDAAPLPASGISTTAVALISFFTIFAVILIVAAVIGVLWIRKKRKDREEYGDSTVRMDIGPEAVMKKRVNTLLKQSSTKQVGKGGTALVFKVSMEDNRWVAMKQLMDTSVAAKAEFHKEVTIFSRLTGKNHPNVLNLEFFCNDPPVIVCELAEKGSLHRMRKEFLAMGDQQKKAILLQVAEGMRFLHENDIVHLDLKPENVLVGEGNVLKISDFGTSLILGQDVQVDGMGLTVVNTFNGTPQYAAPERFVHGRPVDLKRCDVFSYGVLAWTVVSGEMPFDGETGETVMSMHLSNSFNAGLSMKLPDSCDAMLADVVRRCIIVDFRLRPIFFDVVGTLQSDDLSAVPTMNYSIAGMNNLHSMTTLASSTQSQPFMSFNPATAAPYPSVTNNSVFDGGSSGSMGTVGTMHSVAPFNSSVAYANRTANGEPKVNPFRKSMQMASTNLDSIRDSSSSSSSSSSDSDSDDPPPPPSTAPPPAAGVSGSPSGPPAGAAPAPPTAAAPLPPTAAPPTAAAPSRPVSMMIDDGKDPVRKAKANPFARKSVALEMGSNYASEMSSINSEDGI